MSEPLCFVLMPFGKKPDIAGTLINFDAVYSDLIAPAIKEAGLYPVRADEEMTGGIIHKPMFERLIICEYAVADLTTANANVFYELGLRHAVRGWSTVLIYSKGGSQLPFDVAPLRAMPYTLTAEGVPADVAATKEAIVKRLVEARKAAADEPAVDSPVYQLVEGYPSAIDHAKTDVFREQVLYSAEQKQKLAEARKKEREEAVEALKKLEAEFSPLEDVESGVVIDLFLSYRAVKAWKEMISLVAKMPRPLARTVMVQEQFALALNRDGQSEEAEKILRELLERRGPSSETLGLLGRVHKDRYDKYLNEGQKIKAASELNRAIDAYLKGFEADWRDAYPGINAVTLMELKQPPDPRREQLIPIVTYAVERRIASGKPDYWDYATMLELAVLANDEEKATAALGDALTSMREIWEPETTLRNLRLISKARNQRGESVDWIADIEKELESAAQG